MVHAENDPSLPVTLVTLEVEILGSLHSSILNFLGARPEWDQERVFAAALALFLLQSGGEQSDPLMQRQCSRIYLDTMFKGWETAPVTAEEGNAIWRDVEGDRHS